MKKLFSLITLFFAFAMFSNAQLVTIQGGYSWTNGMVGAEWQFGHVVLATGWMPTSMPLSGDRINSYSFAVSWYGGGNIASGYYTTFGISSQGYRYESSSTSGSNYSETGPAYIVMLGYRYLWESGLNLKGGIGYGWNDKDSAMKMSTVTWEITFGYSFDL